MIWEGIPARKASHHFNAARFSPLASAARRRYAKASANSGLLTMIEGRRGGLLCSEGCMARMPRSLLPTRPGMLTVLPHSYMEALQTAFSACWRGMPSRWRASTASSKLGPKNAAKKSDGDGSVPLWHRRSRHSSFVCMMVRRWLLPLSH